MPILSVFTVGSALSLSAQEQCFGKKPVFTGIPAETLCEKFPTFLCAKEIGSGTQFSKSSLLGASITGNVCIVGDFEVDAAFTFQNAIVRINPGVQISVKGSPNGFDPGGWLSIDNSQMFACSGLWKGIFLNNLSGISTSNGSILEDAEIAIHAYGLTALYIQQTTFNRNRIGLQLVTPSPNAWVPGPLVWVFAGNRFTCDAPLNGTTDEITEAGVKLINSYLYTFQFSPNIFSDLQYGVYTQGKSTYIAANNLYMQRIREDGIYMEYGSIKLDQSYFFDCHKNGINIGTAELVTISNTSIGLSAAVPDATSIYRNGIYIGGFGLNANVSLHVNFGANAPGTHYGVRGICLNGGINNVGAGTHVDIEQSSFTCRSYTVSGIYVNGPFPESSDIIIYNNDFDCATYVASSQYGFDISTLGNMNNLHILGNRFNTGLYAGVASGTNLKGSDGINNEVTDNHFYPDISAVAYNFLWLNDFQNGKICSNIGGSLGYSRGYEFWATNTGTVFTANETSAMGEGLEIFNNGLIGPQDNQGNKWFPIYTPGVINRALHHAIALPGANPSLSKFIVHTPQSVFVTVGTSGYYAYFSEYHPENITPDIANEFFDIDPDGSPVTGCVNGFIGLVKADSLDFLIATNQFPGGVAPPLAQNWTGKNFLYKKLNRYPAITAANTAFTSFLAANTNSAVGKFYAVDRKIEEAIAGDPTVITQVKSLTTQRLAQLDLVENLETQILTATTPAIRAAFLEQKKQLIISSMQLQTQYANLSASYSTNSQQKFVEALAMNQAISATQVYESNKKTVNRIVLENIVNHAAGLNDSQLTEIENIAIQSPSSGGMGVWDALAILKDCEKSSLTIPSPHPTPPPAPLQIANQPKGLTKQEHIFNQFNIVPNPTSGSFSVQLPKNVSGKMYIMDITGKLLLLKTIDSSIVTVEAENLKSGTYLVRFVLDDGNTVTKRLVITR